MSKLEPIIRAARLIVARSASDAAAVLSACARSGWLASIAQVRPNLRPEDLAKLAVSLYLAHEQYAQNGIALREMRAGDREYRSNLRQSIKLLKEAEKTAGIFANAVNAIRLGMQSEVTKAPLFDEETFKARGTTSGDAEVTARALLEGFCPRRQIKDSTLAHQIKEDAAVLLSKLGFQPKGRKAGRT